MNARKAVVKSLIKSPWAMLLLGLVLYFVVADARNGLRTAVRIIACAMVILAYPKLLVQSDRLFSMRAFRQALTHPFTAMIAVIVLSMKIGEQFPVSNFPMYAKLDNDKDIYYIATGSDADLQPLPVQIYTALSTVKVGKMFRNIAQQELDGQTAAWKKLTPEQNDKVGGQVLEFFYDRMHERTKPWPAEVSGDWSLVRLIISHAPGVGFEETPEVLTKRSFQP